MAQTTAQKLQTIAENMPKVYEAGYEKGVEAGYAEGFENGKAKGSGITTTATMQKCDIRNGVSTIGNITTTATVVAE